MKPYVLIAGLIPASFIFGIPFSESLRAEGDSDVLSFEKKIKSSSSEDKDWNIGNKIFTQPIYLSNLEKIEIRNPLIPKRPYKSWEKEVIAPNQPNQELRQRFEVPKKPTKEFKQRFETPKKKPTQQLRRDALPPIEPTQIFRDENINPKNPSQILRKQVPIELEIQANSQYWENNNLFVAEGDVIVLIEGGVLKANRIEFDTTSKLIKAKDKVRFEKGSQYFQASSFDYNFVKKKGSIRKVYGVIYLKSFSKDLTLISSDLDNNKLLNDIKEGKVQNIDLKDGIEIKIHNKGANVIAKSISKWRIQSPLITINSSLWRAKRMSLTNDPFNPIQARIEANNVTLKEEEEGTYIFAKGSKLILEEKLPLPLGSRSFGKKEERKWSIGYDIEDRDGFFISRHYKPIELSPNYSISFRPQFLIQRAFLGKTKAYPAPGKSVTTDKVSNSIDFADLFGLKTNLKGKAANWNIDISADISSLRPSRLTNSSRLKGTINKNDIFNSKEDIDLTFFGAYRENVWNGSLGESMIYTAFGGYLGNDMSWLSSNRVSYSLKTKFGIGRYQAESLSSPKLKSLWRTSLSSSLDSRYPLYIKSKLQKPKDYSYRYSPEQVRPSLIFYTNITPSMSIYDDGSSQSTIEFSAWPELTLGRHQKAFFDYTKIAIKPTLGVKSGDSPLRFDNANDLKKIGFNVTQQIIGPLLLSGLYEFNIDGASKHYGSTINSEYAMLWKRRSYQFKLYYSPERASVGLLFGLNGFNFDGVGKPFTDIEEYQD